MFETDGDGEAIVAGYHYLGEKIVRELRGMFAFLIWDAQERVLFGARDWFGIKPLYTYADERGAFFASEKKSLLRRRGAGTVADVDHTRAAALPDPAVRARARVDAQPDPPHRVRDLLHAAPGRDSLQSAPLLPSRLRDQAGRRRRRSCTARSPRRSRTPSRSTCAPTSRSARSCPAASTRPRSPRWPSGTTRSCSPSRPASSARATREIDVAAESAAAIGVEHITKVVTPQEMMDTLPLIVWYLDDPVADPALVPLYFIAREARKHVKVVLSGEGADELFGGYTIYREPISLRAFDHVPGRCAAWPRRAVDAAARRACAARTCCGAASIGIEERYYGNARIFRPGRDDEARTRTFDPAVVLHGRDRAAVRARPTHLDGSTRMQYVDLFTWLRGDILVKADKMTMANSLELRVPFLDIEVFRRRLVDPDGPEDHQGDDEVRAAPGARRHRAAARAQPGQARLPGADPALAQGRDVRLGARRSSPSRRPTT